MNSDTEHRWAVDGIEEGVARIEEDGERMITLPLWLLPSGVREGQLLIVTRTGGADSSIVTIRLDDTGTATALTKSGAQVEKIAKASKKRDGGGNVAL